MVEGSQHFGFAFETGETLWIARQGGGQDFDRYFAIELAVTGSVYLTHATGADRRKDLVRSEFIAGRHFFNPPVQFCTSVNFSAPGSSGATIARIRCPSAETSY